MERARVRIGASLSILLLLLLAVSIPVVAKPVVLEMATLDNFDNPNGQKWAVYGSKFANADYPQVAYVNSFPEALYGRYYPNADKLRALGIRSRWDRKGYNYIEVVPVAAGKDGKLAPSPIPIKGKASRLDLWIWGGNYNYYAEIHLMDFRGVPHTLYLGELNFQGWKNLSVDVPSYIPQFVKWIPQERPLSVTKIVIWTRPDERVDDFFIYFDELKVLADVAENRFDGDQLAQQSFVQQAWKDAKKQGE
jgi:hypothetical protein